MTNPGFKQNTLAAMLLCALAGPVLAAPATTPAPPREVRREAVEENTGEKFSFTETLHANADWLASNSTRLGNMDGRPVRSCC